MTIPLFGMSLTLTLLYKKKMFSLIYNNIQNVILLLSPNLTVDAIEHHLEDWIVGDNVDLGKPGRRTILNGILGAGSVGARSGEGVPVKGAAGSTRVNDSGEDVNSSDYLFGPLEKPVKAERLVRSQQGRMNQSRKSLGVPIRKPRYIYQADRLGSRC